MKRTLLKIEKEEADDKQFFLDRFGINVDDSIENEKISFVSYMLEPRMEYRAYVISGMIIPHSGFIVRDGGFGIIVTNPEGLTLTEEFAGVTAPLGSLMVMVMVIII